MENEQGQIEIRFIEAPEDMLAVEDLENVIWPGDNPVPYHMLVALVHNGGILLGAYDQDRLVGYVIGFIGLYESNNQVKVKHHSHQMAVHPDYQNFGLGYQMKRAQWQMVRQQGIDLITWTYDPLETRNAYLNHTKLGVICNTYLRNEYGDMPDALNKGIPSDRFMVHWWVNSQRTAKRLSKQSRKKLDLAHYLDAGAMLINTTSVNEQGWVVPEGNQMNLIENPEEKKSIVLFEIPANYQKLKAADIELAREWRLYSRTIFELLFQHGYLTTEMVHIPGDNPRCYYILSQGDQTLGG